MDPLELLKGYYRERNLVVDIKDYLVFGEYVSPKNLQTNYRTHAGGYYTVESLYFFLKNEGLPHAKYIIEARTAKIPSVALSDRRNVLNFLTGKTTHDNNIDSSIHVSTGRLSERPDLLALVKQATAAASIHPIGGSSAQEDARSLSASETKQIKALSDKLNIDKIAELKAKFQAQKKGDKKGDSAAITSANDTITPKRDQQPGLGLDGDYNNVLSRTEVSVFGFSNVYNKRDIEYRDLESVLYSALNAFENIPKLLANARNEAVEKRQKLSSANQTLNQTLPQGYSRYDISAQQFSQDRLIGATELQINQAGSHMTGIKEHGHGNRAKETAQQLAMVPTKGGVDTLPIIIIPASPQCLINMWNARSFLESGKYITVDEAKNELIKGHLPVRKESSLVVNRLASDPTKASSKYLITDSVNKLSSAAWKRVVAIFVMGPAWQFKEWPLHNGDPVLIFSKIPAFHLAYNDSLYKADDNINKWNVTKLAVARSSRHLDSLTSHQFWSTLANRPSSTS